MYTKTELFKIACGKVGVSKLFLGYVLWTRGTLVSILSFVREEDI